MSKNFGAIDFTHLTFPNHLRVDYVRVYQPPDAINVGCNPPGFPTEDYINRYVPMPEDFLILHLYVDTSKLIQIPILLTGGTTTGSLSREILSWNLVTKPISPVAEPHVHLPTC